MKGICFSTVTKIKKPAKSYLWIKKLQLLGVVFLGWVQHMALNHAGHQISVFEACDYIGGHSRTIEFTQDEKNIAVDTGFIVFNNQNYPNLVALFDHLDVKTEKSDMSFGVDISDQDQKGWLSYSSKNMLKPQNLIRGKYWKMIFDIIKFNHTAKNTVKNNPNYTIAELLNHMNLGSWFRQYYLQAMGAAIWSTPSQKIEDFPAKSFITFFDNHGLLTLFRQPQWYTVTGGSREYIKKLTKSFKGKIFLNSPVLSVSYTNDGVELEVKGQKTQVFDDVVFACHADTAAKILKSPTTVQKEVIGAFSYQNNKVILHQDISYMPNDKTVWASWIYLADRHNQSKNVSLTYWMNNLQNIKTKKPILVTLNPKTLPHSDMILDTHMFSHPVFDRSAIEAQKKISDIQGINNMWFVGAYQRYGFHEDGLLSAVNVLKKMDVRIPWH